MICANCGREMLDTDRYCGICGTLNPLFGNAVSAPEHTETDGFSVRESITDIHDIPFQEYTSETPEEERPARKSTAGIQSSVAHLRERTPYTQTDTTPSSWYRAHTPDDTAPPKEKEKRTCPLSVVVFCGVVIFFLSVACGVLAGLYLNARSAAVTAPYSLTEYKEG